jgi:hypothetical protein
MYNCEILADSINPQGDRLITMKITLYLLLVKNKFCIFTGKLSHVYLQNNKLIKW